MSAPKKRLALTEFAATHKNKPGTPCWLCGLPERDEIDAALKKGVPQPAIVAWLRQECGYAEATDNRVGNHARNHLR